MSYNLPDIPFSGRFYGRLEPVALADVHPPEGTGAVMLVYDDPSTFLYVANEAGDDWVIYELAAPSLLALPDVEASPANGEVLTWNTGASQAQWQASSSGLLYSKVRRSSAQTISSGTYEIAIWQVEMADALSGFDLVSNDMLFTAPATGVYQHHCSLAVFTGSGTQTLEVRFWQSVGGEVRKILKRIDTNETSVDIQAILPMNSGHTLRVEVQVGGSTVDLDGANCIWEVTRLS